MFQESTQGEAGGSNRLPKVSKDTHKFIVVLAINIFELYRFVTSSLKSILYFLRKFKIQFFA